MKYLIGALRHPSNYRWLELRPFQRHSLVLLVAGIVYTGIGITYACTDPTESRLASLGWVLDFVPLRALGVVWMIVGTLAIVSARWPPASKTWGYSALTGLAAGWASIYLVAILRGDTPEQSMSGVFVWSLVAFLWWAIAGLTNPDDLIAMVEDDTRWSFDPEERPR